MDARAQRLETLFEALIELPPLERDAYLEEHCAGDRSLRQELEQLLMHHDADESSPDFLSDLSVVTGSPFNRVVAGTPPQQIGPYQLLEELGSGGMGTVYRALHTKLQKTVAIKVLHPLLTNNPTLVQRFGREMVGVGKLNHPNIVSANDAGEADGHHFLVMEYLEGVPLDQLLADRGALPIAEACDIVRQAAIGLQHAFEQDLVHRDIKPSNVLLTTNGQVKILDFGLALLRDTQEACALTRPDHFMGTVDYMSPEQVDNSHTLDQRADIYSLGITLYKLLTGQTPVEASDAATLTQRIYSITHGEITPIQQYRNDLPWELVSLIERMVAKDPTKRPQTPTEIANALAPLATGASLGSLLTTEPQDAPTIYLKRKQRNLIPRIVIGGVIVLLLAFAFFITKYKQNVPGTNNTSLIGDSRTPYSETAVVPTVRTVSAWPYIYTLCTGSMSHIGTQTAKLYELCDLHNLELANDKVMLAYLDYHTSQNGHENLTVEIRLCLYERPIKDMALLQQTAKKLDLQEIGINTIKPGKVAWITKPKGMDYTASQSLWETLFTYVQNNHATVLSAYTTPLEEFSINYWENQQPYTEWITELSIPLN